AIPDKKNDNNVGVKFYDNSKYHSKGFTVWTTHTAKYSKWTKIMVPSNQLPKDFNWKHINKISFINYWPGKYYLDDIQFLRHNRIYQTFEFQSRNGSTKDEYGWIWNEGDECSFSSKGEPVNEGEYSWKLISKKNWGGTGIQSEHKKFIETSNKNENQSFWHVDLNPDFNKQLVFWIYAEPQNQEDHSVGVQFFDNDNHFTEENKVMVWTKENAKYKQWTRLVIPFAQLPKTLNLNDINKIQFQIYHPGIYYFDNIFTTGEIPKINSDAIKEKMLTWKSAEDCNSPHNLIWYNLEYRSRNINSSWSLIYRGPNTYYKIDKTQEGFYRLRLEKINGLYDSIPYFSQWSNIIELNN
ncbi:hypothetical protein BVX93_01945, partial [bacterium B13(2017)]